MVELDAKENTMTTQLQLPMAAEELIPHRLPMRQVESLLDFQEGEGIVEALVQEGNPLLDEAGYLSEVALVEMLAQSFAAVQGYADQLAGKPVGEGFLVGIRKISIAAKARLGDRLTIRIRPIATLEGFAVVEGVLSRGAEVLAVGNLKLWLPPVGSNQEKRT